MGAHETEVGSIAFSTKLDNAKLEKDLAGLRKKLEKLEKDLEGKTTSQSAIGKQMDEAADKIAETEEKISRLKAELESVRDIIDPKKGTAGDVDPDAYIRALDREKEITRELEAQEKIRTAQIKESDSLYAKYEAEGEKIGRLTGEINGLKEEVGGLQKRIEDNNAKLKELADNAEIADKHISALANELSRLKEEQKALEGIGVGLGYQEYDQNAARIAAITRELKEYQTALNGTGGGSPGAAVSRTALAAERMNAILSKGRGLLKSAGEAGTKAFRAAGGAIAKTAKRAASLTAQMNVFSKLTGGLARKFHRLGQMIRRVFVFSVITGGLRAIRTQMSGYLKVNAEFMTALRRLQGVLLTAFQPIYEVAVPALTTLINVLARASATVTQFFAALFGTTAKQAQVNAKDLYEQANATTAAGDAAEEAAKQLAGFDEINKLEGSKSAGGGRTASVDTGPLFDYEYDETPFDSWGEAFDAFLDKLLGGIPKLRAKFKDFADWLNDWSKKLYDMFTFPGVKDKVKRLGRELAEALNQLVDDIDWYLLGKALGAGLNLALGFLVAFLYAFDWLNLGTRLAGFINGLASEIDWYDFGRLLWVGFKIALETLAGFLIGLDMPLLAKAASDMIKGFFDSMRETVEKIDWKQIGEQIRTFLVNIDWKGIADSIFGAIKAAFTASSDFFSGLLGEELKRTLVDMLITISKYTLVIGALLALSGANVPLGLGLMSVGAASLAAAAVMDWEYVLGNIQRVVTQVLAILGGALLAIGAILLFSKAKPLLGIGLMAAGAVSLAAALAINWDFLPNTISGIVTKILTILGGALLAVGAVLAFSGANIPLGIGLMAAGAVSLAAAAAVNWDAIQPKVRSALDAVKAIASAALLALGVVLLFSGAGIPLGLGMIGVGARGLASVIDPNWNAIQDRLIDVWSGIQNWWRGGPAKYLTAEFWSDLGSRMINGLFDGLTSAFRSVANWVREQVDWIAGMFSGASRSASGSFGSTRSGSFGGYSVSAASLPDISGYSIPALAQGAVIPPNREFLAVLGDQHNGNNIEAPESLLRDLYRQENSAVISVLREILMAIRAGKEMSVDGDTFAKLVYAKYNSESSRKGVRLTEVHA